MPATQKNYLLRPDGGHNYSQRDFCCSKRPAAANSSGSVGLRVECRDTDDTTVCTNPDYTESVEPGQTLESH